MSDNITLGTPKTKDEMVKWCADRFNDDSWTTEVGRMETITYFALEMLRRLSEIDRSLQSIRDDLVDIKNHVYYVRQV